MPQDVRLHILRISISFLRVSVVNDARVDSFEVIIRHWKAKTVLLKSPHQNLHLFIYFFVREIEFRLEYIIFPLQVFVL